jgi:1-acyl-sn-glycerol-3-phosphate acyltransferase
MLARFSTWLLHLFGWTLHPEYPGVDKYVLIVAPHTSNWDFILGVVASRALKLDAHWMGKHTIFRWPLAWYFRAIGGIPVERGQMQNIAQQMADRFVTSDRPILALAPEGTRVKEDHWKTGFYHIARAAKVPIAMAYLDYGKKQVGFGSLFYPGDDIEEVFTRIRAFYKDRRGKYPEQESLIRVRAGKSV